MKIHGLLVDSEDKWWLRFYSWRLTNEGYVVTQEPDGQRRMVLLSRVIMDAPVGLQVDHINHNKLDNRRCNLRLVTNAQNCQNRAKLETRNKSGYRGVHWDKRHQRWVAAAKVNGKPHYLGEFRDIESAARAARDGRARLMPHIVEIASA